MALQNAGIERADAEILLGYLVRKERTWILANDDTVILDQKKWEDIVDRRKSGEPVAYITGEKEFYGRTFFVDPHALIPRPATERLVEILIPLIRSNTVGKGSSEVDSGISCVWNIWSTLPQHITIVDIGAGSGCIAVTIACELPLHPVIATDTSAHALKIAERNARRHTAGDRITWKEGRSLEPLRDITCPFLLVSNPPYIRADAKLERGVVDFEPHQALFAGVEGMDVLREIRTQAEAHPFCCGMIVECTTAQATEMLLNPADVRPT